MGAVPAMQAQKLDSESIGHADLRVYPVDLQHRRPRYQRLQDNPKGLQQREMGFRKSLFS